MKFDNLQQFVNYIPTCFICQKEMKMSMTGVMMGENFLGNNPFLIQFYLENDKLVSKHKMYDCIIDLQSNKLTGGKELLSKLRGDFIYFKKSCVTCHLKIQLVGSCQRTRKEKKVPVLTMDMEELHCRLKGNRDVRVTKRQWLNVTNQSNDNWDMASITLNNKPIPPVPFDFDKFQSLEQLNTRIATIAVFH